MHRCLRVLVAPPRGVALQTGMRVASRFSTAGFDLPDWFKSPKDRGPCASLDGDEDDEFVLPAKSDFLEERSGAAAGGGSKPLSIRAGCTAPASHEDAEFEADVDEVSRILSSRFASPEAIVVAMDCCSVKVSARLVDKILRRFRNDWVAAFGFFMWACDQEGYCHCADSYDMMVDILGKFKQFDLMCGLISQMHEVGGLVSLATMTKVMRRLCGASRWSDAIDMFYKMDRFGVAKDTKAMNVLLDTLCKERSVKRARGAFQALMGTIPPDESSFNTLVHGWCKARMLKEARETMKEMEEHGFSPSVITYTSLIEAYCMEKDFQTVYGVLDEMRTKRCPPNIITYTIVMHALGKAGRTQEALDTFGKVKQEGCAPDASFYNSLIYILGRAGRLQDANFVVEEMRRTGISPNLTTFNTLISAACDHSQAENALKLLVKMEEQLCKPDIKTYTPLLKLCCRRQWVKTLLFLICHMFRKDITPDFSTYTLLATWLCRNGRLAQSCLFLEEMVLKGFAPKQETFDLVLGKLEKRNMHSAKRKVQLLRMQVSASRSTAPSYLREDRDVRQNCAVLSNTSEAESWNR
ncbi:pentatricopeptide repeat-containing protein At3g22670, mitochondrial-like [Phragmites australis]|uniref:pentatricopeptide repeat-containing protein At3g22670, mitochondrial-like n=1 Tax=Phragmites australis TaxID=29695 RepID=UPI002D79C901|nr:pentatricopeptide repeat-containing protein At3g22670, mitochondrial-like [Phragmites australis]